MTEQQLRLKIVAWATARLGAAQGDKRHREIIDVYNSFTPRPRGYRMTYTADWCAAFASAAFIASDMARLLPVECSCGEQIKQWQRMGRWEENDAYRPSPGDLIYYDWQDKGEGDNTGAPDHVGIVVDVTGTRICVVEGNKGDRREVATRLLSVGGRYIRGYGLPDYASLGSPAEPEGCVVTLPMLSRGSRGEAVKALQTLLNLRGGCNSLDIDGSFGPATENAARDFQAKHGLTVDGSVGPITWAAVIERK